MPELPEVETTRRGLAPHLDHATLLSCTLYVKSLRQPLDRKLTTLLHQARTGKVIRRGKYLLLPCHTRHNKPFTLIFHLGMSGSLRLSEPQKEKRLHDRYSIALISQSGGEWRLDYHDPRRFGMLLAIPGELDVALAKPPIAKLGIEPLSGQLTAEELSRRLDKRRTAIKIALLNASIIAGIGNIYACESLFTAAIDPRRLAGELTPTEHERLVAAIISTLERSIAAGGTTLRDFLASDSTPGYFAQSLNVYGRHGQPCRHCQTPIETLRQGGRSSFYCPSCQL